ncbi:MAG: ankyrin repeat domain-containing protein [Paracoccaceae bacterium]|nr:ankyrin repeat domain-containing protein [Paracoccaceae bacterium]
MADTPDRGSVGRDAFDCARAFHMKTVAIGEDYEWSSLFNAVISEDPDWVEREVSNGADPNQKTSDGTSALGWAAWRNEGVQVINRLIPAGTDPRDRDNQTQMPLHRVCLREGSEDLLLSLVDGSVEIAISDENLTCMHILAALTQDPKKLELLAGLGASPDLTTSDGSTALHPAADHNDTLGVISMLAMIGVPVDATDDQDQTALHRAVSSGNAQALDELLQLSVDETIADSRNRLPLDLAITGRNQVICEMLRTDNSTNCKF